MFREYDQANIHQLLFSTTKSNNAGYYTAFFAVGPSHFLPPSSEWRDHNNIRKIRRLSAVGFAGVLGTQRPPYPVL